MKNFENFITAEKNINQYNYLEHRKKKNLINQGLDSLIIDNLQKNVQHIQIKLNLTKNYTPKNIDDEKLY